MDLLAGTHLRRQVVQSATHRFSAIRRRMHTPAKVCQFYNSQTVEEILRFDIPMNNVLAVDVLERLANLMYVVSCQRLLVPTSCLQWFI